MQHRLKRRELVTLLGGAVAWPVAARAQQAERMRRIGVLMNRAANSPEGQDRLAAFHQGLQERGWSVGRNVRVETRWGEDDADLERKYAAELVALAPDAALASGTLSVTALQHVSRTLPIVFAGVTDPLGAGFVESLARPGGNATGFMIYEYSLSGKWLEILKEIAPRVTRVAVIRNPGNPAAGATFGAIQNAAQSLGFEISPINVSVRDTGEIERAVAAFARSPNGGLVVTQTASAPEGVARIAAFVQALQRLRLCVAAVRAIEGKQFGVSPSARMLVDGRAIAVQVPSRAGTF